MVMVTMNFFSCYSLAPNKRNFLNKGNYDQSALQTLVTLVILVTHISESEFINGAAPHYA